jgi:predicted DNA-binding protein (MmcQ/YjbR family)
MPHDAAWADTLEGQRLLKGVRALCQDLPEVHELVDGFGHHTFKVRGKSFVITGMGESGTHLAFKSDLVNQALLTRREPFFRTPYIGQHGWVSMWNPLEHDRAELAVLIEDAWRMAASKRLVKALDGKRTR